MIGPIGSAGGATGCGTGMTTTGHTAARMQCSATEPSTAWNKLKSTVEGYVNVC